MYNWNSAREIHDSLAKFERSRKLWYWFLHHAYTQPKRLYGTQSYSLEFKLNAMREMLFIFLVVKACEFWLFHTANSTHTFTTYTNVFFFVTQIQPCWNLNTLKLFSSSSIDLHFPLDSLDHKNIEIFKCQKFYIHKCSFWWS